MLLLTSILSIACTLYRARTYGDEKSKPVTDELLDFVLLPFLIVALVNSPFARFEPAPIAGKGLNPLLQTYWMAIHPPIVFLGYVLVILDFTLVLMNIGAAGRSDFLYDRMTNNLLQAAWLFTTMGIAIGGLWSYEVLGWGGYWSWDPIETSSLLPWLALTAYFHLGPLCKKNESLTREFTLLLAFLGVIFTMALTRGGLLTSVHAFGASPVGSIMLIFGFGMAAYFFYRKRGVTKPLVYLQVNTSSNNALSSLIAYVSLMGIFLVSLIGVTIPLIGGIFLANALSTRIEFYIIWIFPLVIAFVIALIGCNIGDRVGLRGFALIVVSSLIVGFVLVQVQWPTPSAQANLGMPLIIIASSAILYNLTRILLRKTCNLRLFGRGIIHLAVMITLIGIFVSSTTKQEIVISGRPRSATERSGLMVEFGDLSSYSGIGRVQLGGKIYPESSTLKLDFIIEQSGSRYNGSLQVSLYTAYGVEHKPFIITTTTGDLYLYMGITEAMYDSLVNALFGREVLPLDVDITVEIIPMSYLVRLGVILLCIGIALPLIGELIELALKCSSP